MADEALPKPPAEAFLPKPPAAAFKPAVAPDKPKALFEDLLDPARHRPTWGENYLNLAPATRKVARFILPSEVPSAISLGASAIPGEGLLAFLGRSGIAAALGGITGGTEGAVKAGGETAIGSAAGGLGRAGYRLARAGLDKAAEQSAAAIAKAVPEFGGKTWQETISRIVGGEGLSALRQRYDTTLKGLFKQYGDPPVWLPSLSRAKDGSFKAGFGAASDLKDEIARMRRSLYSATDDLSRRSSAGHQLDLLYEAERELEDKLAKLWPKAAQDTLTGLRTDYRQGMAVQKLFGAGREKLSAAQVKRLVPAEGQLNISELQALFQSQAGRLERRAGPIASDLDRALFRGETNPLVRDVPGRGFGFGGHVYPGGASIYPRHLPHAPRLAGEGVTGEEVAQALRMLGARGSGAAVE